MDMWFSCIRLLEVILVTAQFQGLPDAHLKEDDFFFFLVLELEIRSSLSLDIPDPLRFLWDKVNLQCHFYFCLYQGEKGEESPPRPVAVCAVTAVCRWLAPA